MSANWTAAINDAGFAGTTTDEGVAGHGSSSPYDIHNTLIAAGPEFREHAVSDVPTANVDVAPTLLHLLGLPPVPSMTGRIIDEGLREGPAIALGGCRARDGDGEDPGRRVRTDRASLEGGGAHLPRFHGGQADAVLPR